MTGHTNHISYSYLQQLHQELMLGQLRSDELLRDNLCNHGQTCVQHKAT